MDKMKKLYEKVEADISLQSKLNEIMENVEKSGEIATEEKLTSFAEEAGFGMTPEEIKLFFKNLSETQPIELSEEGLSKVAGGFSTRPFRNPNINNFF